MIMQENDISVFFAFMAICCRMCRGEDENHCCPFKECIACNKNFEKLIEDIRKDYDTKK